MHPSYARSLSGGLTGPVLGLESSCDETAAAVLDAEGRVMAEIVLSQLDEHRRFGGVVPEIAARAHLAHLPGLVRDVLAQAGVAIADLAGIGASCGPGLIGGLIVGAGVPRALRWPPISPSWPSTTSKRTR